MIKYITNKKYRFFCSKIKAVQRSIWELEFKIMKKREEREGFRLLRDRAVENKNQVEIKLKGADEKNKADLENQVKVNQQNIDKYEDALKVIDSEINGIPATEDREAVAGLLEMLEKYSSLRNLYKDYLKQI
jgi:hypothetical protein